MSHLFGATLALTLIVMVTGSLSTGPNWHRMTQDLERAHPQVQLKADVLALLSGKPG